MSPLSRYEAISVDIRMRIASGEFKAGERLPSEVILASRYNVSRMTVRHAVEQLVSDRLVVRRRGSGTFVNNNNRTVRRMKGVASYHEEVDVPIAMVSTKILFQGQEQPDQELRRELRMNMNEMAVKITRLRCIREVPTAIQESWLPYALAPSISHQPLINGSLYETLRIQYGILPSRAEQEISAVSATTEQSELLEVRRNAPLLTIRRVTFMTGEVPFEVSRSWARPHPPLFVELIR